MQLNIPKTNVVKPGFYVCEQAIEDECKVKEMKIDIAIEIKYIKFILFYIQK
jgi:hypothetical protein